MQAFQDVFISYGRRDSLEFAARLNRRLVDRGFTVWFDYDDIPLGVDYQQQIDDGIERADNFLFIISPHAINSPYCRLELDLALKHHKRIIPLLHVEKISYETWRERNPDGTKEAWAEYQTQGLHDYFQNMHPTLRKINWVYGREGQDDFEAAFTGLLTIFDRHKDYVHHHTLLLAKALAWEQQQKRSQFLLIGEERLQAETWLKTRFKDSQPPCLPTDLHCEFITESVKNAENLMSQVFLAYADRDRSIAQKLRNSLMREGFTVWTSAYDIRTGADFRDAINRGIEEADNIAYILSPAAIQSDYCQQEIAYALSLHKRIILILAAAIEPHQIPAGLQNLQYIDLTDNLLETDYQQDESQLIRALRENAAYHTEHKILLAKALKWQRQQQNPTFLLRGYNLRHTEAWLKVAKQTPQYPPAALQEDFIAASLRQPPGISLDVFISYSRVDSGMARQLNDRLQIHDKRTWFDQESIAAGTADFQQEIYRGIESADHFLFILSPNSVESPYCADEVEYAAKLNKRFVTILYRPIDPAKLHPELAKVQWLDFTEGDDSANVQALLRILDTDVEHLHAHTRLLLRSIEWNDKGRKESLLLRGDELDTAEQWLAQSTGKEPQPTELQQIYIANSRSVETANQQATQILQAAAAKGKRLVWMGAAAGAIGLLVAGVAGWAALQARTEIRIAALKLKTVESQQQLLTGQTFNALLTALKAGQDLQSFKNSSAWNTLQPNVIDVLQQSTREVSEINTLNGHQDSVRSVSFSPNGKTLASTSNDETIRLWDVAAGKTIQTLKGHQSGVMSVSFSPDGKMLASASWDKTIKLWDVATGKVKQILHGHQAEAWSVSFSPDGKTLASASADKTIKLWDVTTGTAKQTLSGHQDWIYSVSFSPDGKTLASASADKTIKLWDVTTGTAKQTLSGHQDRVRRISFSPDGKTLASASQDKTIKLWDVATGKANQTLYEHQDRVNDVSFSPNGKTLASASTDKTIKLWDVATGEVKQTLSGHATGVSSISFSPDGKTLASASGDNTIKLWNIAIDQTKTGLEHQAEAWSVSFSPNSKTLAVVLDKTIKLWDVAMGQIKQTLSGHQDGVINSVSFSPDGNTLAAASSDKTIKLWDVTTGKVQQTLSGHQAAVSNASFSPDGKTLASASDDKTIKLWDVTTGKVQQTFSGHQAATINMSFSPDGKTLASASDDKTIKLWDVTTGKVIQTLSKDQSGVMNISFSPNGKMLASANVDKTIRLWDVATGQVKQTLSGHQVQVNSVSFSPDGKTLASASGDKTIKLWDVATGKAIQTLSGHQDWVWSVSFSPDGKMLASASLDKTVRIWVLDFDRLMTMGCNHIRTYLETRPEERSLCQGYL